MPSPGEICDQNGPKFWNDWIGCCITKRVDIISRQSSYTITEKQIRS